MTKRYIEDDPVRLKRALDRGSVGTTFVLRAFLDRALDLSNMAGGQYAIAYGLMAIAEQMEKVREDIASEEEGKQPKPTSPSPPDPLDR